MNRFFRKAIRLFHRLCPKRNHAVIWGWPDHEDSVIALEGALQQCDVRKVILLVTDPHSPPPWKSGQKTIRVKKNTPAGFLWFCSARYVFFTHPCFTRTFPAEVVSVNVWHGMPLKKIGWLMPGDEGITCRHTLATSPFWSGIMERAMNPGGNILTSGLPRNDRLFVNRNPVLDKLGLPHDCRLFVWLPTYRRSVRGFSRTDGIDAGNVFEMPDVEPDELNRFLQSRGAVMLVKPHPMAASDGPRIWSNLFIIDESWLRERSLSLYEALGVSDLLISDISSVVIDYLLLDKPIIHAFRDQEAYQGVRGFTVDPISDYFVGPVVTDLTGLLVELDRTIAGEDLMADKRREICRLSHQHRDAGATRRLLDAIGISPH